MLRVSGVAKSSPVPRIGKVSDVVIALLGVTANGVFR